MDGGGFCVSGSLVVARLPHCSGSPDHTHLVLPYSSSTIPPPLPAHSTPCSNSTITLSSLWIN